MKILLLCILCAIHCASARKFFRSRTPLLKPEHNATFHLNDQITFEWEKVEGAISYSLNFEKNKNCAAKVGAAQLSLTIAGRDFKGLGVDWWSVEADFADNVQDEEDEGITDEEILKFAHALYVVN